jgi:hypothetical protein
MVVNVVWFEVFGRLGACAYDGLVLASCLPPVHNIFVNYINESTVLF